MYDIKVKKDTTVCVFISRIYSCLRLVLRSRKVKLFSFFFTFQKTLLIWLFFVSFIISNYYRNMFFRLLFRDIEICRKNPGLLSTEEIMEWSWTTGCCLWMLWRTSRIQFKYLTFGAISLWSHGSQGLLAFYSWEFYWTRNWLINLLHLLEFGIQYYSLSETNYNINFLNKIVNEKKIWSLSWLRTDTRQHRFKQQKRFSLDELYMNHVEWGKHHDIILKKLFEQLWEYC